MNLSAFDWLLHNAFHTVMCERDLGHGKATNWRAIVEGDVLAAARELFPQHFTPPPPPPASRADDALPNAFREMAWRSSEDWQIRASNDDTFHDHERA